MNKMLVAVFNDETKAYEGVQALKQLHAEGSLTLYSAAVIARDANGKITVKDWADRGPIGTVLGVVTGSLIGLLGGPAGMTAGAAVGTIAGSLYDLAEVGIGRDFFDEVSRKLSPGKVGVIAEIDEEWVTPLDTRMEPLGGVITRRPRSQFVAAETDEAVAADKEEFAKLQAEFNQAVGNAKTKMKLKLDAARERLQAQRDILHQKMESINKEGEAKIKAMQEQAAKATGEMKAQLEKRLEQTRTDYKRRADKLHQAWELIKEAAA